MYLFAAFQDYRLSNRRLAFPGFMIPPLILGSILLLYFSAAWSAFCVSATFRYTSGPEVIRDWVYFVLGAIWCLLVFVVWAIFALKRMETWRIPHILHILFTFTTIVIGALTVVSYVVFALFPDLIQFPYGWLTSFVFVGEMGTT